MLSNGLVLSAVKLPHLRYYCRSSVWAYPKMMTGWSSACVMVSPAAALFYLLLLLLSFTPSTAQPGFLSLDCGGETRDYTDEIGIHWISDSRFISSGQRATLPPQTQQVQKQLRSLRYFPVDNRRYCYNIDVRERARYLVRATFLYGSFDESPVYPKFRISLGAARWSTVVIDDPSSVEAEEAIVLTQTPRLSVCLSDATTGRPFISTLELRMFSGSLYSTPYEADFFLGLSARINFGAESNESIRYPDDQFDRIWKSDMVRSFEVARGTRRVSTARPVFVRTQEEPPQRVMQTAVVGQRGLLSYQFLFEKPPGNSWVATYYAEIEDFDPTETRNFTVKFSGWAEFRGLTVDVAEQAGGKYRLYEPRFINVSVHRLLFLELRKRSGFSKGPIINAIEIYKYLPITAEDSDLAKRRRHVIIIAVPTASAALLLIIIVIGCCCCYFRGKKNPPPDAPVPEEELVLIQASMERYTLSDIEEATNRFERQIGSGGSAHVYYGKLPDGREIAAKSLVNPEESVNEFTNEISLLSKIHHRNVVSFLGYSQQGEKSILVYEFMHYGTLKQHLPGGGSDLQITSWAQRLQIATDAARGMEYIHIGCTPAIIHRDLKTTNILLDSNMRAKIADFGLAKPMVDGPQVSRRACGTLGYADPWYADGHLSDIYSFGVILLELLSGREVIHGDVHIVTWARPHIESGNVEAIIDGSLDDGYKPESVRMIAALAIRCVSPEGTQRPSSTDVVRDIEEAVRVELPLEAPQQVPPDEEANMIQAFHELLIPLPNQS